MERNSVAEKYLQGFSENKKIVLPQLKNKNYHAWHLFVIRVNQRRKVVRELDNLGIQTVIHYPIPIHRQKAYKNHQQYNSNIKNVDYYSSKIVSLPIFPKMTRKEIDLTIKYVNLAVSKI